LRASTDTVAGAHSAPVCALARGTIVGARDAASRRSRDPVRRGFSYVGVFHRSRVWAGGSRHHEFLISPVRRRSPGCWPLGGSAVCCFLTSPVLPPQSRLAATGRAPFSLDPRTGALETCARSRSSRSVCGHSPFAAAPNSPIPSFPRCHRSRTRRGFDLVRARRVRCCTILLSVMAASAASVDPVDMHARDPQSS